MASGSTLGLTLTLVSLLAGCLQTSPGPTGSTSPVPSSEGTNVPFEVLPQNANNVFMTEESAAYLFLNQTSYQVFPPLAQHPPLYMPSVDFDRFFVLLFTPGIKIPGTDLDAKSVTHDGDTYWVSYEETPASETYYAASFELLKIERRDDDEPRVHVCVSVRCPQSLEARPFVARPHRVVDVETGPFGSAQAFAALSPLRNRILPGATLIALEGRGNISLGHLPGEASSWILYWKRGETDLWHLAVDETGRWAVARTSAHQVNLSLAVAVEDGPDSLAAWSAMKQTDVTPNGAAFYRFTNISGETAWHFQVETSDAWRYGKLGAQARWWGEESFPLSYQEARDALATHVHAWAPDAAVVGASGREGPGGWGYSYGWSHPNIQWRLGSVLLPIDPLLGDGKMAIWAVHYWSKTRDEARTFGIVGPDEFLTAPATLPEDSTQYANQTIDHVRDSSEVAQHFSGQRLAGLDLRLHRVEPRFGNPRWTFAYCITDYCQSEVVHAETGEKLAYGA